MTLLWCFLLSPPPSDSYRSQDITLWGQLGQPLQSTFVLECIYYDQLPTHTCSEGRHLGRSPSSLGCEQAGLTHLCLEERTKMSQECHHLVGVEGGQRRFRQDSLWVPESRFRVPHGCPPHGLSPHLSLKNAIFSLTFFHYERILFCPHQHCCVKVVGSISSPSEAYKEYLIMCPSTLIFFPNRFLSL